MIKRKPIPYFKMKPPGADPDTPRHKDEESVNGNQFKQRITRVSNNIR